MFTLRFFDEDVGPAESLGRLPARVSAHAFRPSSRSAWLTRSSPGRGPRATRLPSCHLHSRISTPLCHTNLSSRNSVPARHPRTLYLPAQSCFTGFTIWYSPEPVWK